MPHPLPTRSRRNRLATLAVCAPAWLAPLSLFAQEQPETGARPLLEYRSDTGGYRGLDDEAEPAPAAGMPTAPDEPASDEVRMPTAPSPERDGTIEADAELGTDAAPVPEPIRKLQASTADRRGQRPQEGPAQEEPADASADRRLATEYESAFDAYERFEESDGPDWVGANETVGRIGGWKTYAREMYESASGDELDDGDQE